MARDLLILEIAEDEISEAFDWYEQKVAGLGAEFAEELNLTLSNIITDPFLSNEVYSSFRRALLNRFPYKIWYEIEDDIIVVWAVVHVKRHPNFWKKRLT